MKGGPVNFSSMDAPDTSRRNNKGLETVSITPNGKTLLAVLQSATLRDTSTGKSQTNRAVTCIYAYDISTDALPKTPKALCAI
jgi:hypothetical protein